ncbi:MAG: hypothetical protein IPJ74_25840 [Saprospiraceae bacterium]|nr:hypothetical protein [Saprospiraceae bacterium]
MSYVITAFRIIRVELTDQPWEYMGYHNIMLTDPFRIVDSNQVMVHLRMRVGGSQRTH